MEDDLTIKEQMDLLRKKLAQIRDNDSYWRLVREQFLLQDDLIYLNNGTLGPVSRPVLAALESYFRILARNPRNTDQLCRKVEETRQKVARFIGAAADEIVLTRNTTEGMSLIANGLVLKKGDEVLTSTHEHPGGAECWKLKSKRDGIVIKRLSLPSPPQNAEEILQIFADNISKRTKVISISHITCTTGLLMPVKELCRLARDRGIVSVIDGAHPVGMIAVDVHDIGCDFYANSPHKWLLAPIGTGVLFVRKEVQDKVWPTIASSGWDSQVAFSKRFETFGTRNWPEVASLGDAIDFQEAIGRNKIEKRVRELTAYMKTNLVKIPGVKLRTSMDAGLSAAITSLSVKNHPLGKIMEKLRNQYNIVAGGIGVEDLNAVRFSAHIYNTTKEIDIALQAVEEIAKHDPD